MCASNGLHNEDPDFLMSQFYDDDIALGEHPECCVGLALRELSAERDEIGPAPDLHSFGVTFSDMTRTERRMTSASEYLAIRAELKQPIQE